MAKPEKFGHLHLVYHFTILLMLSHTFQAFFDSLSSQNLCFYHFRLFFDKVSNFRNSILTNQKREWWFPNVSGTVWQRSKTACLQNLIQQSGEYDCNYFSFENKLCICYNKSYLAHGKKKKKRASSQLSSSRPEVFL